MKHAAIYVSSVTGNTRKISLELKRILKVYGWTIEEYNTALEKNLYGKADLVIVCFWCRRSGMDKKSLMLVEKMQGEKIAAFGTMGSYADGEYGNLVRKNVQSFIEEENTCQGVFLCRGKIAPERTEKRRRLPKDHPHYLDDSGYERHITSRTHPDKTDLMNAGEFLRTILENNFNEEKKNV